MTAQAQDADTKKGLKEEQQTIIVTGVRSDATVQDKNVTLNHVEVITAEDMANAR